MSTLRNWIRAEFATWRPSHFVLDAVLTAMLTTLVKIVTGMDWLPLAWWAFLILVGVTAALNIFVPQFGGWFQKNGNLSTSFSGAAKSATPKPQASAADLEEDTITSKSFKILQVPRIPNNRGDESIVIENKTFVDCEIYGPAIMLIGNATTIAGESRTTGHTKSLYLLWEWDGTEVPNGVIVLNNCRLIKCHFFDIAFMLNKASIAQAQGLIPQSEVVKVYNKKAIAGIASRIDKVKSNLGQLNANVLDARNNPNNVDRTTLLESLKNEQGNLEQIVNELDRL